MVSKIRSLIRGSSKSCSFCNHETCYKQLDIQKSFCQPLYAFTVGGKRILGKIYLLFTRLVIGLYIDFKFNSVSIEQTDNVMSSKVS